MATEADDNVNLEPAATREQIDAALEAVKKQGLDINPYSIAREAGIAPETLFTNSELMALVIEARGDQSTFTIDSQLAARCQELEGEMFKLMEINQEIYDRALEMEERVIQLEAKITDMEEDTEHLTMQLQNSWHLGYKKGLSDGQSQEVKSSQKPMIDIELPKEEAEKEVYQSKPVIEIELPKDEPQTIKSLLDIELPEAQKLSRTSLPAIERPKEEPQSIKSLLDIELPEAQKLSRTSVPVVEAPKQEKQSIKSLLDIELPEAEKQSVKSLLDIELPKEEKQSIKSLLDIELPKEQKQSIKSLLDIELPKEETPSQTDFSADEGKDTLENPPVSGDHEPVADSPVAQGQDPADVVVPPQALAAHDAGPAPSYNDRVFNAVSDGLAAGNLRDAYGGMSWREVETIYQYSASGSSSGPNLVFEPLAPGQAVGARASESPESKALEQQTADSAVLARGGESSGNFNRGDTQPIISRTDTQPILAPKPAAEGTATPPILKADAPTPKPAEATAAATSADAAPPSAKASPRSTFTNLTGRPLPVDSDPPMERTMSQFLGDTNSYINLDRVTMEPLGETSPPPPQASSNQPDAPAQSQAQPAFSSQAETQTLAGATQALAAEARARAAASTDAAAAGSATSASTGAQPTGGPPTGPTDAKWVKRDANATYDGLTALEGDSTADVLDLDKLDIFEGLEDIDELNQIEVIEDVVIPGMTPPAEGETRKSKYKSSEHIPVVSSDDLHDLIKSRIKKAEDLPPRFDAFISPGSADKAPVAGASTSSGTHTATGPGSASAAQGTESAAPPPVPTAKELEALRQGARNKFVGGKASAGGTAGGSAHSGGSDSPSGAAGTGTTSTSNAASARAVPPEIRKACMILGVRPEDLTLKEVNEKWKAQLTAPGVHPDQGGDTESAIYLNTAKDTLVKWINDQNSKLGKKFGKKDDKDK